MPKPHLHPCGLTTLAVRQHETGSKPLGKTGLLALRNWEECERLREQIAQLEAEVKALTKALNAR